MKNPLARFKSFWKEANRKKDPTADYLLLATTDPKGNPHVRTVLIKTVNQKGIGFVTNRFGPKVQQFKKHRRVEGCVVWPTFALQVRLGGIIKPMPQKWVDQLWKKRLREAQILYSLGLKQSQEIPSYNYLKREVAKLAKQWRDKKNIPTAPSYVGYIIQPTQIEFLHHNPTRLNLREHFQKTPRGWVEKILAP